MALGQLPAPVEEFARYLRALTARLDAGTGWYGVFAQRDPEGIRACLAGQEVPPWDIVQALLQDLSAQQGAPTAREAAAHAAALYRESVTAYDTEVGDSAALQDRLDVMLRERQYAATRERDLKVRLVTADAEGREEFTTDLAWARDDRERATARCEELRARLDALAARETRRLAAAATQSAPVSGSVSVDAPEDGARTRVHPGDTGPATDAARSAHPPAGRIPPQPTAGRIPEQPMAGRIPESEYGDGDVFAPAAGRDPFGGAPRQPGGPGADAVHGTSGPGPDPFRFPGAPAPGATASDPATSSGSPGPRDGAGRPAPGSGQPPPGDGTHGDAADPAPGPLDVGAPGAGWPEDGRSADAPGGGGQRRPRGARFAGVEADASAFAPEQPAVPTLGAEAAAAAPDGRETPRGARFAGAHGGDVPKRRRRGRGQEAQDTAQDPPVSPEAHAAARAAARRTEARNEADAAVARLARLRAEGRTGEAHAVLCETAVWPAERLPLLAGELERTGLGADVSTLLWEVACLPPDGLAAAADALAAAGRDHDCGRLLRQSVARPVSEVARTALALRTYPGRHRETAFLLGAFVRARTPEEVAQAAVRAPEPLVPLLLDAADGVSTGTRHDLAHALRTAGVPGVS